MSDACLEIREQLALLIEDELAAAAAEALAAHLEGCASCRELAELMASLRATGRAAGAALVPPARLRARLAGSPCERWLALMFHAIDHELPADGLGRLVDHLEACPSCHRAWDDLTLIHQVGAALLPRDGLAAACATVRRRPPRRQILGRRTAIAAAYVLAVLTSLAIGNPVTTARMPATTVVHAMTAGLSADFDEVAADSRGELKVMLWRTGRWVARQAERARALLGFDEPAGDRNEATLDDDLVERRQGD